MDVQSIVASDQVIAIPVTTVEYAYTGYSNGTVIVRGHLTLLLPNSGRVRGRWQLRALADTTRIGPQHGQGVLVGERRNGSLTVNLNPTNVDNNVILVGEFDRLRYAGRWSWVGFAGVLTSGTFEAVRVRHAAEANAE